MTQACTQTEPQIPTVEAYRHLRRMRGGSKAHLLECKGGRAFVTKFVGNPQGTRVLVNEWMACRLLRYLQIQASEVSVISISQEFIDRELSTRTGLPDSIERINPGNHLGLKYPGELNTPVYDYLPDSLLHRVVNVSEFAGTLLFDLWTSNMDESQAIFFRPTVPMGRDEEVEPRGLTAQFIDFGFGFAKDWNFTNAGLARGYFRSIVYGQVHGWNSLSPWLDRIISCPASVLQSIRKTIPPEWIEGEERALENMLEQLHSRRLRVTQLVSELKNVRPGLFPDWR